MPLQWNEGVSQARPSSVGASLVGALAAEPSLFVLSAKNSERLEEYVKQWISYIPKREQIDLENVAYTLQVGREEMPCRLAIVTGRQDRLLQQLEQWLVEHKNTHDCYFSEATTSLDGSGEQVTQASDLHEKALSWVAGNSVSWYDLHKGQQRVRITGLPTYPFKPRTCWIGHHQGEHSQTGHTQQE